ncbi:hypothetical protein GF374_03420 [Candidatus Woesearchaeota archaeon]|nr:hypothetical protein [Candidatus Woesearchaeota archaeon]
MPDKEIDRLLSTLRTSSYPNVTLYLIWHYLNKNEIDLAVGEYCHDGDKLGSTKRKIVEDVFRKKGITP